MASLLSGSAPQVVGSSRRDQTGHNSRAHCRHSTCHVRAGTEASSSSNTLTHPVTTQIIQATQPSRRQLLLQTLSAGVAMHMAALQPAAAALIEEEASTRVFESVAPSVVSVADFQVKGGEEVAEGVGSGFVWDRFGHIVTNYHCIAKLAADKTGSQRTTVAFLRSDGSSAVYAASIVGTDAAHDLAVLKVDAPQQSLQPIRVGQSATLKVGQSVFAIGNPFGLSRTLTAGVVSGLNRAIPSPVGTLTRGAIQTDASISAGNSGGPLLDSSARVVGVNTATFTRTGSGRSSGVNFALPIDLVMTIVPNLIVGREKY